MNSTIESLQELVTNRLPAVNNDTLFGAIVGGRHPSRYAVSPRLWNTYAELTGAPLRFLSLDMGEAERLPQLFEVFVAERRFIDLTVTDPYKQAAYRVLEDSAASWDAEPVVRRLQSINHLIKPPPAGDPPEGDDSRRSQGLWAMNTDGRGMVEALASAVSLENTRVLLIGAGGAALSIGYELLRARATLHVANAFEEETERTVHLLRRIFPEGRLRFSDFSAIPSVAARAGIIINTVPTGCPVEQLAGIASSHRPVIAEATYGEKAALAEFASERGLVYVGGRTMLFGQFACAVDNLQPILCSRATHTAAIEEMRKVYASRIDGSKNAT